MTKIGWRFPPLSGGNEQGYTNSAIETFKGVEIIDNLAREICQNSLDAKDEDVVGPVIVKFEMESIRKSDYDVFSGYEACIEGCKKYWRNRMDEKLKNFIDGAEKTLNNENINILIASDYNTLGLSGSKDATNGDKWKALTSSDGVSVKADEGSGGSYGIGKNAPFACSSLSMVFYNTYAKQDGVKAFQGVARLATLIDEEGNDTQGVGHYRNNETNAWKPIFDEDDCAFKDKFKRNKYGTDIIIVGFNEEDDWINNIEKAVINNFFLAIYEGKLLVEIQDNKINAETMIDKIKNVYADDKGIQITSQLLEAIINPDREEKLSILEENDSEVYIKADSGYSRTIANFRSTGMMVGKYSRRIFQHYAAVLIVRGQELSKLLLATEPPRHNRWDYKLISKTESEKRKLAKEKIKEIENKILELLKEQYEVVTEKRIDGDVGEYLPDETDELGGVNPGDDILRAKQQIVAMREKEKRHDISKSSGHKDKGSIIEGKIKKGKTEPSPPPSLPPIMPSPSKDEGILVGDGSKIIITPHVSGQRVYPLDANQGIYRVTVKSEEDYDNIYMSFSAIGEDEAREGLIVECYKNDGEKVEPNSCKIGPILLRKDETKEIVVHFANKEKMLINIEITEEHDV